MPEPKTKPNEQSVKEFLDAVEDPQKREDSYKIMEIMQDITEEKPIMWGGSMVGFGNYHFKYESGREGDWFLSGFSPRKNALTLYIMSGFSRYNDLLNQLGKYKTGKSCLYVKKLEDIDIDVLKKMISFSVEDMRNAY